MAAPPAAARVTGLEELAEWIAAATAAGALRFELWRKARGVEQERVHVARSADAFDAADELLAQVERDRRADRGQVVYGVFAYGAQDKEPRARAIVSLGALMRSGLAAPAAMGAADVAGGAVATSPSMALSQVLLTIEHMTRETFATLQRENDHQRRTNESLFKASTAYFETFAKGYERTFEDLRARLEGAITQAAEQRAKSEALADQNKALGSTLEELTQHATAEQAEQARKTKREDLLHEQLRLLVPILLSKITKRPLDAATVAGPGFSALLDSLDEQQLTGILSQLREPQRLFVVEVLSAHRAKKKNAAAAAHGGGPPTGGASAGPTALDGFLDAKQADAAASASPVEPDLDREFRRMTELLDKHGKRYNEWLERHGAEFAAAPKTTSPAPQSAANDTGASAAKGSGESEGGAPNA